jgi:hypothetical protein
MLPLERDGPDPARMGVHTVRPGLTSEGFDGDGAGAERDEQRTEGTYRAVVDRRRSTARDQLIRENTPTRNDHQGHQIHRGRSKKHSPVAAIVDHGRRHERYDCDRAEREQRVTTRGYRALLADHVIIEDHSHAPE